MVLILLGVPVSVGGLYATAAAQERILTPASPRCGGCTIVLSPWRDLGAATGPGILEDDGSTVVMDGRGRFYLVGNYPTRITVFDPNGAYLQSVGRGGDGPGEYRGIGAVVPFRGDSLLVLDNMQSRATVLDHSYEVARTVRLAMIPEQQVVRLANGELVIEASLRTPARVGQPFHRVATDGQVKNSFGATTALYRPDIPFIDRRALAHAGYLSVWSGHRTQYLVEMLSAETGAATLQFRREVSWFPPRLAPGSSLLSADVPPEPFLRDLHQDDHGYLWVLITVAGTDWRTGVRADPSGGHGIRVVDEERYYASVIEVINPAEGSVMASLRVPHHLTHFVGPRLVAGPHTGPKEVPQMRVYQLDITKRP
jgi:hypothetical protein